MAAILVEDGVNANTAGGISVTTRRITPRLWIAYNSSANDVSRSYGVSSITAITFEGKPGQRINFTASMATVDDYCVLVSGGYVGDTFSTIVTGSSRKTSSNCFVYQTFPSNNVTNPTRMCVAIFD
jgi:hypothetical protein